MMTRIGYGFLIFSFLSYGGCYQTSQLMKEDLDEQVSKKIDVFTVNNKHYQFDEGFYHIHADTLFGRGTEIGGRDSAVFVGTIPINAIKRVEQRTFNYKTAAAIVGATAGVAAVITLLALYSNGIRTLQAPGR